MHETPHFETRLSPWAKLIHPWGQEHFNQTRVSPLLLQAACNPVLMRFLVIQKPGLLPSLSSPKCCWTLAPHQGKPAPAPLHSQVTWGPPSPACLLGMSGPFACCQPKRSHGSKTGSQLTISRPLQDPSCLEEPLMASPSHFSDGEMEGTKAGGQCLVDNCSNNSLSSRRRGRSREGGEVMKYAQNLVWNRWSRTRLLVVFLHLTHKEKRFHKTARSFQPSVLSKKRIARVFCITASPCPSPLPDPSNGSSSSKEKSSLFTPLTHLCLVPPGSGTQGNKVEFILRFIGDWNREKWFLLN